MPAKTEELYEAITSFHSPEGTFKDGDVVAASHPAVKKHGNGDDPLFVPERLDDLQKAAARRAHRTESARKQYELSQKPTPPPPPPSAPKIGAMEAIGTFTIQDKDLGGPRVINQGDLFALSDPLVLRYPWIVRARIEQR